MPLLVPIHEPSAVITAALGKFFDKESTSLVAATVYSLQFFDEHFNLQINSVSVASPVCSIGTIKNGDTDAIVLCLEDGRVEIVKYMPDRSCFVSELVFQIEKGTDKLQVLCANSDNSVVILRSSSPSQLLVLRAGKTIKASLYGGRWGKIFDACLLSNDKVCMIENDPSTNPQLGFYSLSTKGLSAENTVALTTMDPYQQLRLCPISEGVLVYDFESVQKFNLDGESLHVIDLPAFCLAPMDNGILVSVKNGSLYNYSQSRDILKEIGKLASPPTNFIIRGNLAFCWGSGSPTQVIQIDSAAVVRSLPTLGPVMDIIPLLSKRPGKILALTSSIFELECYDSCFSTLSRLDFGIPASHVACVEATLNPVRTFKPEDSTLIFSTNNKSIVFDILSEGIRESSSYMFYDLGHETLAGNAIFQVCPGLIKTANNNKKTLVTSADVSDTHVVVAHLNELKVFSASLELEFSEKTPAPVTLVKFSGRYTAWATDSHVYICQDHNFSDAKEYPMAGITDIAVCGESIFIGDREGKILVWGADMQHIQTVSVLHGPVKFCYLCKEALLAHGDQVLRLSVRDTISYELVHFSQKVGTLACISDQLILTTRQDTIDLWSLEEVGMACVNTVGTQESIDAMLQCGKDLITASRDEKDVTKCHLHKWNSTLSHSELMYTLTRPDEIVEQIMLVEFSGFSGILVALNHSMKDVCQLLLLDLNNLHSTEPRSIKIGTGMIVKMVLCKHPNPDKAQVYFLNSSFVGAIEISKDGADVTVLDKKVYVGRNFDVLGDEALLFDYFEKSELCSISAKSIKHKLWLEDTQETSTGLILPATSAFAQRSYLIATESRHLYQFEVEEQQLRASMVDFNEKITTMCRLSLDDPGPFAVDALMGSANGGLYAYFRLPPDAEKPLALLCSRIREQNHALCAPQDQDDLSALIQWKLIRDMSQKELVRVCDELNIDIKLVDQARESVNALVY